MTTYTLTINTSSLGLGVIDGGKVVVTRKRATAADQYPPVDALYEITTATGVSGVATASIKADDSSTYHVCRVWDANGAIVYQASFAMPPEASSLHSLSEVVIGASNIQFQDEGSNRGTPSTVRTVNFTGNAVSAAFASETLTVTITKPTTAEDVSADPAGTASATVSSHAAAADPHGDRAYAESLVTGLWDDRGTYDASGGAYPSSGGSGTAGAIKKGDIWTISVAGTLPTAQSVEPGDTVRALADTPGNTQSNWAIAQNNIGYVPESSANKSTDGTMADNSTTKYPSQSAVVTYVGSQINAYGNVESQAYRWFEDFIALGETSVNKLIMLRCRSDNMTVTTPTTPFTNASVTGASHAMGWGQIYNTGSLGIGSVAVIQNYDGYSKVPVTASKELIWAGSLDTLPTNTSTTDCVHRIGMCWYGVGGAADPMSNSSASAYFQADKDGFWKCFSGKTGANQNTTTVVATAAMTYISLRIVIAATTGVVSFYIDGVLVATHNGAGVVPYEQGWFRFIALYNQGAGTFPSSGGLGGRGNLFVDAWGQLIKAGADRTNLRFLT